jgi:hypothetical protein
MVNTVPEDSKQATSKFKRLCEHGSMHTISGWSAFGWLDQFEGSDRYLTELFFLYTQERPFAGLRFTTAW